MIFDTHAHYDDSQFDEDRDSLLKGLALRGIGKVVNISAEISSWEKVINLTRQYDFIYGTIGVHPDEVGALSAEELERLESLLSHEKIVAVGEIGLDYYWNKESRKDQIQWFAAQLDVARKTDKPVVIHSREAAADTMEVIRRYRGKVRGVIHCYSYSADQAKEYIKMGYMIGVGGVVTFKNARRLKETVEQIPLSSIVLETDCPYLAPEPNRGKRNDSGNLIYVAEEIARIKRCTKEEVVRQTWENGHKLYRM